MELFTKQHQMNAPAFNVLRAVVCKYREAGAISKNVDFFFNLTKIQYSKAIFKSSSEASFLRKIGKLKIGLNPVEGLMEIMQIRAFLKRSYEKMKVNL